MKDMRKTKQQLAEELSAARERISDMQTAVSRLAGKSEGTDSDEKFRSIFEKSQDVLVVVDTESGTILSANPTISQVLNYEIADVVGKHFSSLYRSGKDPDEESADSVRIHGAVIEAQEVIKSDGSVLLMDLTATLIPWDGTTAILFTLRDASERVEAENALRENEEQLRTITNAMPDLVCFKDGEGRWLQANDYAVELFDLHEIDYHGKTDYELAHRSSFHYDTLIRLGKT